MRFTSVAIGLGIEVVIFGMYILWGAHGMQAQKVLDSKNKLLVQEISALQQEIGQLETYIADWHTYPFYKEHYARTQLHMALPGEQVYVCEE